MACARAYRNRSRRAIARSRCAATAARASTPRSTDLLLNEQSRQLEWIEPWTQLLDWKPPYPKWFVGGKLNARVNCLDRHVAAGRGDKVADHWECEPGDARAVNRI